MSTLGQIRRYQGDITDNVNHYLEKIDSSIETDTITHTSIVFTDTVIKATFKKNNNYYIKFNISPTCFNPITGLSQTIKIYLTNDEKTYVQTIIDSFTIDTTETSNITIEKIISANYDFTEIYCELIRNSEDYKITTRRVKIIENSNNIYSINNLWTNDNPITKIGIQGPPNLLMCINGEEIRIGYSGIYEIYIDYEITFLGFAVTESLTPENYFIVDYQY